jgi:xanthine dehydrogenase accessory factor
VTPDTLAALLRAQATGTAIVLATRLPDGAQRLLPDATALPALQQAALAALTHDKSVTATVGAETWFLHVHAPLHRLLIIGAVHIAQSLAPLAALTGLAVTVIDPRRGFANDARFPSVALYHAWPDEALAALMPDTRTAIVTLTHDAKLDDPALDTALRSPAFFIGALGSRKTHAARLDRLRALGHDDTALGRIRGPVGLRLGAVTAPEIALSILAELVAVRRGSVLGAR